MKKITFSLLITVLFISKIFCQNYPTEFSNPITTTDLEPNGTLLIIRFNIPYVNSTYTFNIQKIVIFDAQNKKYIAKTFIGSTTGLTSGKHNLVWDVEKDVDMIENISKCEITLVYSENTQRNIDEQNRLKSESERLKKQKAQEEENNRLAEKQRQQQEQIRQQQEQQRQKEKFEKSEKSKEKMKKTFSRDSKRWNISICPLTSFGCSWIKGIYSGLDDKFSQVTFNYSLALKIYLNNKFSLQTEYNKRLNRDWADLNMPLNKKNIPIIFNYHYNGIEGAVQFGGYLSKIDKIEEFSIDKSCFKNEYGLLFGIEFRPEVGDNSRNYHWLSFCFRYEMGLNNIINNNLIISQPNYSYWKDSYFGLTINFYIREERHW